MDEKLSRKLLVVSAVNLVEGGTLRVLQHFLDHARRALGHEWRILALVNHASIVGVNGIEALAFPRIKARWLNRLWFEYLAWRNTRYLMSKHWPYLKSAHGMRGTPMTWTIRYYLRRQADQIKRIAQSGFRSTYGS